MFLRFNRRFKDGKEHRYFCNGPGIVKGCLHSRVIRSAGVVLLYGVGAKPPPDGFEEDKSAHLEMRGLCHS
jgi:hypothetical protein